MQTPWTPCTTAGPNFNVPPKKEAEKSKLSIRAEKTLRIEIHLSSCHTVFDTVLLLSHTKTQNLPQIHKAFFYILPEFPGYYTFPLQFLSETYTVHTFDAAVKYTYTDIDN